MSTMGQVLKVVRKYRGRFSYLVHNLVDVDAVVVGHLFVVAVPAGVEQCLVLLVFLGVQHVVALLTEADPNKTWTLSRTRQRGVELQLGHHGIATANGTTRFEGQQEAPTEKSTLLTYFFERSQNNSSVPE